MTRTETPLSRACCVGPVLYSPIAPSCSMAEFRVECLTYSHSRVRLVPFPTSPSCGLPPTATIPARRLINIKRSSCLDPRTFVTGTYALTTRSPTLATELPGPASIDEELMTKLIHYHHAWWPQNEQVFQIIDKCEARHNGYQNTKFVLADPNIVRLTTYDSLMYGALCYTEPRPPSVTACVRMCSAVRRALAASYLVAAGLCPLQFTLTVYEYQADKKRCCRQA